VIVAGGVILVLAWLVGPQEAKAQQASRVSCLTTTAKGALAAASRVTIVAILHLRSATLGILAWRDIADLIIGFALRGV
jgi:hypothetical protein